MAQKMTDTPIILIACGGTIDKVYYDAGDDYRIGEPAAADISRRARADYPPPQSLIKKDSLEMTDDDRAAVVAAVRQCAATRIVITHGTDTMALTAAAVAAAVADKTVVLCGAFLPAAFRDSDADFNVGFALGAASALPAGVYVAMNGRIFPANQVKKNRAAGRFEQTDK